MTERTQVLVAGAGPVGTTLAMDLARLGVDAIIVDQRRGVPPNPKCNTTNARSMELFRRLGCADAVRAAGLPEDHNTDVVYMTRLNGAELVRFERSTPAEVRAGAEHGVGAGWPTPEPQHFISQIFLEPVLRDHAAERWGVEIREGWELVDFDGDDDGVTAQVRDVDTGEVTTILADHLVGADGASSGVRRRIGATLQGIPRLNDMCSTYFRSKRVTEIAQAAPGWMLRFASGGILVAIDGADGWLLHLGVPAGEDPDTWDPEEAMFAAIGEPFDYEILDRSRWTPRAMVADRWRAGRVFLAGDAAHLWVPMGGFGMNAGIADATALSWRLAGALAGWAGDALLDSYQLERAPIGESIAEQAVLWSIGTGRHMAEAQPHIESLEAPGAEAAAARTAIGERISADLLSEFECPGFQLGYVYSGSPVVVADELTEPAGTAVVDYVATSWPGARLPHVDLGERGSIFDHLGDGFTLIRVGPDAPSGGALVSEAERHGIPLRTLDVDPNAVGDAWDGAPLILVRPDDHVAWRSVTDPTQRDAAEVLAVVTGRR